MANRKVTGPMGTWELIVTKALELPEWKQNATYDGPIPGFDELHNGKSTRVDDQMRFANAQPRTFLTALSIYIVDWFKTLFANRRSNAVRIRAVNWDPPVETLVWTTTKDAEDRILEEIAEGLAQGKVVQPEGAVYSGAE